MTEQLIPYRLNIEAEPSILSTEADTMRAELVELERRLIPLLIAVQRALGKESSVMDPQQRRQYSVERRNR